MSRSNSIPGTLKSLPTRAPGNTASAMGRVACKGNQGMSTPSPIFSGTAFRVCPKGADYQWGKDPLE